MKINYSKLANWSALLLVALFAVWIAKKQVNHRFLIKSIEVGQVWEDSGDGDPFNGKTTRTVMAVSNGYVQYRLDGGPEVRSCEAGTFVRIGRLK